MSGHKAEAGPGQNHELGESSVSLTWVQGYLPLLPRTISKGLGHKRSSWDLNWCSLKATRVACSSFISLAPVAYFHREIFFYVKTPSRHKIKISIYGVYVFYITRLKLNTYKQLKLLKTSCIKGFELLECNGKGT